MRAGDPEAAVLAGVGFAGDLLATHVPRGAGDLNPNERPDAPQLLD